MKAALREAAIILLGVIMALLAMFAGTELLGIEFPGTARADPDCWPGAIYCAPAGTPEDSSVTFWDGHEWVSGASTSYGQPCSTPGSPCAWAVTPKP